LQPVGDTCERVGKGREKLGQVDTVQRVLRFGLCPHERNLMLAFSTDSGVLLSLAFSLVSSLARLLLGRLTSPPRHTVFDRRQAGEDVFPALGARGQPLAC